MSAGARNLVLLAGAILAICGVLAIAVPYFTTTKTTDVAKIAGVQLAVTEQTDHRIPPWAGPAALIAGIAMLAAADLGRSARA